MENFKDKRGVDSNIVISELKSNGYKLNFMPLSNDSFKSLFYAKKGDEWLEFCTTVKDGVYGTIVWVADYNYMIEKCAENLEKLEAEYNLAHN